MPILTKQDVRKNFRDMISHGYPRARMVRDTTSGSTGTPLMLYRTLHQESWGRAAMLRAELWHGFHRGEKWGFMIGLSSEHHIRSFVKFLLQRVILYNTSHISLHEDALDWFVRRLQDTNTKILHSAPTPLYVLSRFVEQQGTALELEKVISQGETLDPAVRANIERVFGCGVLDLYGSTEIGFMAAQCPGCSRYIVSDEVVHLEVLEHEEGCGSGDVVGTSLVNYGMPFIRYSLGDVASGLRDGCECGRAHTTMSSIEGKVIGLVARRDGGFIRTSFRDEFKGTPVKQYSVVQRDYDKFTVFVVPDEGFAGRHVNAIVERMKEVLGSVVTEFEVVEDIPPPPGGKHRFVYSEVPYQPPWLEQS